MTRFHGTSGAVRASVDTAVPVWVLSRVSGPSATLKVICPFYGGGGPTPARAPRRSEARRGSRCWAHAGEGPAAKRSETWEPVGTRVIFVSNSARWEQPR